MSPPPSKKTFNHRIVSHINPSTIVTATPLTKKNNPKTKCWIKGISSNYLHSCATPPPPSPPLSSATDIMPAWTCFHSAQTWVPHPGPLQAHFVIQWALYLDRRRWLYKSSQYDEWLMAVHFCLRSNTRVYFFSFGHLKKCSSLYLSTCTAYIWNYTYIAHLKTLLCLVVWKNTMV